jgi:hypothetical protein
MIRLRGHFDGDKIVLDEPVPQNVGVHSAVEISFPDERDQALRERQAFYREFWSRPLPRDFQPTARTWKREELYERGGGDLS